VAAPDRPGPVPAAAAIDLGDVTVHRGGREVLHPLTARVEAARLTGLIGPSGSGKSTLMRAIVGVQLGVSGALTVLGRPAGDPTLRSEVGYLTQEIAVYADISVRANLDYFATLLGAPAGDADRVLEIVDLSDVADRRVDRLSGGQSARVALASALLGRPHLLVLDEPTVGLDPALRADLWSAFHRLTDEGVTLLVSSHVMDEAARCDEVMLLRDGDLIASAPPGELLDRTGTTDLDAAFLKLVST
jgi:ABC-2 type transport system ATP-binding protein